jgi:hypothetical protein
VLRCRRLRAVSGRSTGAWLLTSVGQRCLAQLGRVSLVAQPIESELTSADSEMRNSGRRCHRRPASSSSLPVPGSRYLAKPVDMVDAQLPTPLLELIKRARAHLAAQSLASRQSIGNPLDCW